MAQRKSTSFHGTISDRRVNALDYITKRKLGLGDPWYQLVLRMMNSNISTDFSSKTILEIGCGKGGFSIRMSKICAQVVGLDISANSIRQAKNLAKDFGHQRNVDFVIGDAQFPPFREGCGFITVCSETLEHVPHFSKAFEELVKMTERSGYLFVTVPNYISTQLMELCLWSIIRERGHRHGLHIFHYRKIKKLFQRENLEILDARGTDFFHIPFLSLRMMNWSGKGSSVGKSLLKFMRSFEKYDRTMRFFGSNVGILARIK